MAGLNTGYLSTNRGVIKILQIIAGFVVCSLLCANWYGGKTCFGEGRLGFASGLNFVIVVINIVLFLLNFLNVGVYRLERMYSVISCVLFLAATILMVWFIIENNDQRGWLIGATVGIVVLFLLFLWDVKILQGESPN